MFESPEGPWALVFDLQRAIATSVAGAEESGLEEALDVVLDAVEASGCCPSAREVKNLCTNRAQKHRQRRALVLRQAAPVDTGRAVVEQIHARQLAALVEQLVPVREFDLLMTLTELSYEEVALAQRTSVGALKARASRCRKRLRDALGPDQTTTRLAA